MRPPGGYTMDMFNYANDLDLYYQWASILVNGVFTGNCSRPYFCGYVGRKQRFNYAHPHHEITAKYGQTIVLHAYMPSLFQSVMGEYFYIFRTKTEEEVRVITEFILQKA